MVFAGTLASKYEKLGGEVKWMGKPDKVILIVLIRLALLELFVLIHMAFDIRF